MKIDKRIRYRLVVDTETCPIDSAIQEVNPRNMLTYDIGWAVVDKRGKVYLTRSYVVADIFLHERARMESAYYADKIPRYWEDINRGARVLASWQTIKKIFYSDLKRFSIDEVYAHNMPFDNGTLIATDKWVRDVDCGVFFPRSVDVCDTLRMARQVIGKMPTYIKFCAENGFTTSNGKPRFTAEILYRFISKNIDFEESHTGLEDVMIEKEILAYCFKQHKAMNRIFIHKNC